MLPTLSIRMRSGMVHDKRRFFLFGIWTDFCEPIVVPSVVASLWRFICGMVEPDAGWFVVGHRPIKKEPPCGGSRSLPIPPVVVFRRRSLVVVRLFDPEPHDARVGGADGCADFVAVLGRTTFADSRESVFGRIVADDFCVLGDVGGEHDEFTNETRIRSRQA